MVQDAYFKISSSVYPGRESACSSEGLSCVEGVLRPKLGALLQHNLKMEFALVADVVRHLNALDFVSDSSEVGILTNSATLQFTCAEV